MIDQDKIVSQISPGVALGRACIAARLVRVYATGESHGDVILFYVNFAFAPVAWVAWLRRSTVDQARALPPDAIGNLLWEGWTLAPLNSAGRSLPVT